MKMFVNDLLMAFRVTIIDIIQIFYFKHYTVSKKFPFSMLYSHSIVAGGFELMS